jgi:hypothetical protein
VRKAQILFLVVGIAGTLISVAIFVIALSADQGSEDDYNAAQAWQGMSFLAFIVFGSIAAAALISWYRTRRGRDGSY